jgi:hypothetical protein
LIVAVAQIPVYFREKCSCGGGVSRVRVGFAAKMPCEPGRNCVIASGSRGHGTPLLRPSGCRSHRRGASPRPR